jgi:hypothetical protein
VSTRFGQIAGPGVAAPIRTRRRPALGRAPQEISTFRTTAGVSLILFLVVTACASPRPHEPSGDPYVRGAVEAISSDGATTTIFVRAGPGSREPCGIVAKTDSRTGYFHRGPAGHLVPATLSALQRGDTVEVFVTGPVMESCPVQGYASVIVALAGPNQN